MRVRLLPAALAVTFLAVSCGEAVDVGANPATLTTTSTTQVVAVTGTTTSTTQVVPVTAVTAVNAADLPGGIVAAEAESERQRESRAAAEAAYAALYPNAAALQVKAEDIVNRYQSDPGLWAVWAQPEDDTVNVRVDDQTLYDTLIAEYGDDPEIVIRLGPNCGAILLSFPPPPPPPECAP